LKGAIALSASATHTQETRQTIRTMSMGTLWRLLRYPFIVLSVALVPRMMGDEDYGTYAYFVSLFVILNAFTDLGFLQIYGRFIPESEAQQGSAHTQALARSLFLVGVLLAAGMVCLLWFSYWIAPWTRLSFDWVLLLGLSLILTRVEGTFFNLLYGQNQIARFSAKEMFRSAFTLLLVLLLYHFFGLTGAFWGLMLNEMILTVIGWVWVRSSQSMRGALLPWRVLRPYLGFGIGFFVPALFLHLLQRAGNVYTEWWTGDESDIAFYDIANQYLLLTSMFIGLILQTLLPSLAKLQVTQQAATMLRWQRAVLSYCAVLAVLSINTLIWLGEPLILFLLGEAFQPVFASARIMTLAILPSVIAYAGMNYALLAKSAWSYICSVGAALLVMTCCAYLWAPASGATGVTWATVAGYWVMGLVFLVWYWRDFRPALGPFVRACALALILVAAYGLLSAEGRAWVWFLFTSFCYAVLLIVFRVITWTDIRKFREALSGR
jgi:O-antigen/teichoic acid export membrane protein